MKECFRKEDEDKKEGKYVPLRRNYKQIDQISYSLCYELDKISGCYDPCCEGIEREKDLSIYFKIT